MSEDTSGMLLGAVHSERWSYACAKQLLERLIWAHGVHEGLRFTIIRPFNVIGARMDYMPGVDGEGVPRVLAAFMHALMTDRPLLLVNGGDQRRSFVFVDDFVQGVLSVLRKPRQSQGEIINLGNPNNDTSIHELAGLMADVYCKLTKRHTPVAIRACSAADLYGVGYDDTQARLPDIRKAEMLLDFRPKTSLAQMIPGIIEEYLADYAHRMGGSTSRSSACK